MWHAVESLERSFGKATSNPILPIPLSNFNRSQKITLKFLKYKFGFVHTGQKSLSCLGPKIWSKVDPSIKNVRTSFSFMHAIKRNILLHLQS